MTDTAQPATAADPEVVPTRQETIEDAANAFKVALGQEEAPERPRGPDGKFVSPNAGDEDSGEDEPTGEAIAEGDAEPDELEAAEEAQPDEPVMPASWAKEDEAIWHELPPEAQAKIAEREGQRDRAVNQKFQEAANLRQAHEAEINEANANRARYAEAVDQVLSLVVTQPPPRSMLDINSSDYDPDGYHYQKAVHEDTIAFLNQHAAQRQNIAAQEQMQRFNAINGATRDSFIELVPDVADKEKSTAVFQGLMEYAVSEGAPADLFSTPITALEWKVLWKAKEYDRLQSAKARVSKEAAPPQRKPQPAVRPGVTTPRSAIEKQRVRGAMDRLAKEGTVEAGAAALKHLMKGALR